MATRRPAPTPATSAARLAEIDAAIAELCARQAAQPKAEVGRRALLAVLISAFERRRDLTEAALEGAKRESAAQPCGETSVKLR